MNAPTLMLRAAPDARVQLAAQWLEKARQPVCIVGRGGVWSGAGTQLLELCNSIPRLRIASTPAAKGVFPECDPRSLGVWGFSGHQAATEAVAEADVLLVVGSRLHEPSSMSWHARFEAPHVVRIDLDPSRAGAPRDQHIALTGDAGLMLDSIRQAVTRPPTRVRRPARWGQRGIPRFPRGQSVAGLVKPQSLFEVINRVAPTVRVSADAGNAMCWAIEWLERSLPRQFQVSVDWGTMGFALPAAIGAFLAKPHAPVIAITGDGSLAMAGGELHTAVELEIPVVVVALNDSGAGMVRAGSEAWFGPDQVPDPSYRHRMQLSAFARGFGAHAEVITSEDHFELALRGALERRTPTLLDVQVDAAEVPRAILARVHGLADTPREGGGMC